MMQLHSRAAVPIFVHIVHWRIFFVPPLPPPPPPTHGTSAILHPLSRKRGKKHLFRRAANAIDGSLASAKWCQLTQWPSKNNSKEKKGVEMLKKNLLKRKACKASAPAAGKELKASSVGGSGGGRPSRRSPFMQKTSDRFFFLIFFRHRKCDDFPGKSLTNLWRML